MTAGDLTWDHGGPVGFAAGVQLGAPNGTTYITSSGQVNDLVAALEAGKRVIISAGVTITMPGSRIVVASGAQLVCLSGTATLDCTAQNSGAQFYLKAHTIWGNIHFIQARGVPETPIPPGNPAWFMEFADLDSDYLYMVGCTIEQPVDIGVFPNDGPEGLNCWDNTGVASGPRRITVTHTRWIALSGVTKAMIIGGFNSVCRMQVTLYKCVSYTKFRSPLTGDLALVDIVNCAYPPCDRDQAIRNRNAGRVDVRGCMFDNSGPAVEDAGGAITYAPLSGAGTDNNYRTGAQAIASTQSVPTFGKPYTLTPDAADGALLTAVVNGSGAGNVVFAIEGVSAPVTPPPPAQTGPADTPGTGGGGQPGIGSFSVSEVCAINFAVNGKVLTAQPMGIQLNSSQPQRRETMNGYYSERAQGGRSLLVQWGEGELSGAALADIRKALITSGGLYHLTWTDPDGTQFDIQRALLEAEETAWQWDQFGFFQPLQLLFHEV